MAMEGVTVTTSGAFTGAILAEKLTKLNVTQQSIETLSHWCIFHRKKAREIVETWAKQIHDAPREQGVPFLYLANDILQNSRRKGPEFVNEFWTVLPRVLRDIVNSGDESVKHAAYRLVDIWEERRVFGSRPQGLREELLGKRPPQVPLHEARHSIIPSYQMFEGSVLERVARSYHAVQEKSAEEHGAMSKYYAAVSQIESLEKEAKSSAGNEDVQASIANELLDQQTVVRQCIEQFEGCEISHGLLCTYLKDFLHEQERNLEQVRARLQIAHAQLEQVGRIHHRLLTSPKSRDNKPLQNSGFNRDATTTTTTTAAAAATDHHKDNTGRVGAAPPKFSATGSAVVAAESSPQATSVAAEVAAKLTANSSSAAVFTSVLSSLAAEEANGGVVQSPNGKRSRVESRPGSDPSSSSPLPPPMPPYPPLPYAYESTLPPPPPLQGRVMLNQHPLGLPPQPIPPGCAPAEYHPFPQASSMQPYYSQPPLPAPPAPTPRQ